MKLVRIHYSEFINSTNEKDDKKLWAARGADKIKFFAGRPQLKEGTWEADCNRSFPISRVSLAKDNDGQFLESFLPKYSLTIIAISRDGSVVQEPSDLMEKWVVANCEKVKIMELP